MNLRLILMLLSISILVVACANATKYKSAEKKNTEFGYTDTKMADGYYRVTFTGNSETQRSTVDDYMLFRTAQLAKKNNARYIEFLDKELKTIKTLDQKERDNFDYQNVYGRPSYVNYTYPYYTAGIRRDPHATRDQIEENYKAIAYIRFHNQLQKGKNLIPVEEVLSNIQVKRPDN